MEMLFLRCPAGNRCPLVEETLWIQDTIYVLPHILKMNELAIAMLFVPACRLIVAFVPRTRQWLPWNPLVGCKLLRGTWGWDRCYVNASSCFRLWTDNEPRLHSRGLAEVLRCWFPFFPLITLRRAQPALFWAFSSIIHEQGAESLLLTWNRS